MKAAVVFYSETGNTKLLAEEIKKALEKRGVETLFSQVESNVPARDHMQTLEALEIKNLPSVADCDIVFAGGPVMGFRANGATMKCISEMKSLKGKKFVPFVTQYFPFSFMGGSNSVRMMSNEAKRMGAEVMPGIIINVAWHDYKKDMASKAEKSAEMFL